MLWGSKLDTHLCMHVHICMYVHTHAHHEFKTQLRTDNSRKSTSVELTDNRSVEISDNICYPWSLGHFLTEILRMLRFALTWLELVKGKKIMKCNSGLNYSIYLQLLQVTVQLCLALKFSMGFSVPKGFGQNHQTAHSSHSSASHTQKVWKLSSPAAGLKTWLNKYVCCKERWLRHRLRGLGKCSFGELELTGILAHRTCLFPSTVLPLPIGNMKALMYFYTDHVLCGGYAEKCLFCICISICMFWEHI